MRGLKDLIPFQGESVGSLKLRKILSLALIIGLLQTFSWTYQIIEAPKSFGAKTFNVADSGTITVPTGVDTVTVTVIGGGAGSGGIDGAGNTNPAPGARGKVTATFRVTAGEVLGIWSGRAGSNGSNGATNSGGGSGGVSTLNSTLNGGAGGNAGSAGGSGGGGGGGAASVFTIGDVNTYQIVAGGAGGGGGQSNAANTGQPGKDDNSAVNNSSTGGNGVQTSTSNSGVGKSCTTSTNDGGGGGGGGGGFGYGGAGGQIINGASGECAGDGGYRGGNYTGLRALSITSTTDNTSNTSAGQILITYQLNRPTNVVFSGTYRSVRISWNTTNAPSSYLVRLYDASENFLTSKSVDSSTSTFAFTPTEYPEMKNGTAYKLSVTAAGDGVLTDTSTETVRTTVTTASIGTIYDTDTAISLNGTGVQQVYAADSTYNRIPDTFTAQAWIYPTSYGCTQLNVDSNDENCHILSKGNHFSLLLASSSNAGGAGGTSGQLGFIWSGSVKFSKFKIPLNEWHHVAFSREGSSASQAKLYVDGNLIYEDTATANSAVTTRDFTVGSSRSDATSTTSMFGKFRGQIDEVKLSTRFRTQSEIRTDMHSHNETDSSFLLYYDFNEVTGNAVYNRINNANSGTDLTITFTSNFDSSKIFSTDTTTASAYTTVQFFRTYLVTANGWRTPSNISTIRYLVVSGGGGGGGGWNGGGGGAGGYLESTTAISPSTIYRVQVGTGGLGALFKYGSTVGETSSVILNSTQATLFATVGGGAGGTEQNVPGGPISAATSGGSGGGGVHAGGVTPGAGIAGQGFSGGIGLSTGGYLVGGGGGGAGGAGSDATTSSPGAGGIGKTTYITGQALNLAGGGAGSGRYGSPLLDRVFSGTGGGSNFGGGTGAVTSSASMALIDTGTSGVTNTGGGGGAGAVLNSGDAIGGNGGSGFVVIKYITTKPIITKHPTSDTVTVGAVETFTITTSAAPSPLSKSVNWQFTADTTTAVEANITGWTNVTTGTGLNTDTYTTVALTTSMNKYRYRAIVTFSDTTSVTSVETSTIAVLTLNSSINITADSSTITRKYGDSQTVRTITYSGGTTNTGAVGTSTSHRVTTPNRPLAGGKIWVDTTTSTAYFKVDTGTAVGTYTETVTVTDFSGVSASYVQRVVVNPADTLTVSSETPTATTYTGAQAIFTETRTVTGLVAGDTVSGLTYNYSASSATCANGGLCNVGDIGPSGGYVFYVSPTVINVASGISTGGVYLEAAPVAAQGTAEFGCTGTQTPGTSYAVGSGAANTKAIIDNCATAGIAARVTSNLTYAGFSDWFMPSLDEMTAIYNNLYNKTPSLGGFTGLDYGSSSQGTSGAGYQAYWWFGAGAVNGQTNKNLAVAYRPVRAFNPVYTSSINYGPSTTKPTNAGTYTITPSAVVLANNVDTSNYVSVVYRTSTFTINKARQDTLTVGSVLGVYETGTATMQLTTLGGTDTGTVTYAIATGGTASGCSISSNVLTVTSAGTCKLAATKAATLNYLIAYSDTATITFSRFASRPLQVQLYPSMIPLNGGNSLETNSVTASTLVVSSITRTGAGAYTIAGTGFSNIEVVRIGGTDLTGSNYTVGTVTSITLTGVSSLMGPLFIRRTDGQEVVNFQVTWN